MRRSGGSHFDDTRWHIVRTLKRARNHDGRHSGALDAQGHGSLAGRHDKGESLFIHTAFDLNRSIVGKEPQIAGETGAKHGHNFPTAKAHIGRINRIDTEVRHHREHTRAHDLQDTVLFDRQPDLGGLGQDRGIHFEGENPGRTCHHVCG